MEGVGDCSRLRTAHAERVQRKNVAWLNSSQSLMAGRRVVKPETGEVDRGLNRQALLACCGTWISL